MPDFVEELAQQIALNPAEIAILRQAGVRSLEDVDSLLRNFSSLHTTGQLLSPFRSSPTLPFQPTTTGAPLRPGPTEES